MSAYARRAAHLAFGLVLLSILVACQARTDTKLAAEPPQASPGPGAPASGANAPVSHVEASSDGRKRRITAQGFTNLAVVGKSGHYNLVLFSTDHCDPCKYLWDQADGWLRQYANLAVTDIDVTRVFEGGDSARAPELAVLRDFGLGRIPSAVLVSPLGYVVIAKDGADAIEAMVHRALRDRPYRDVIPFDGPGPGPAGLDVQGGLASPGTLAGSSADAIAIVLRNLGLTNLVRTERVDGPGPVLFQGQSAIGDKVTVTLVPDGAPLASGTIEDLEQSGAVARIGTSLVAIVVERDTNRKRAHELLASVQVALQRTAKQR